MQIFFSVIHRREMHDREINGQKAASMLPQNERNKYNVPKKCSFGD